MVKATDAHRLAQAHTPLGAKLIFREMSGREELSRPFEYRLELWAEDDSTIDPKAVLGRGMTAEIEIKGGGSRFIDAQCTRFSYIGTEGGSRRDTRFFRYEARLSPWIYYMGMQSTSRVFQNKTVPDILRVVFAKYSEFSVEITLTREYRVWEYCVQYQETDLNFMSRLCEHEGVYYYFRHELGRHTLVLCDDMGAHAVLAGYARIPHLPPDKVVVPNEEFIDNLRMAQEVDPGNFFTKDFDLKHPSADLKAVSHRSMGFPHGNYEIFDWPGGYVEVHHGEQYARVRLEELQQAKEMVTAESTARGLAPGFRFTLERCVRRDQNREYLIRAVDLYFRDNSPLSGGGVADWRLTFLGQPTTYPYRPPRISPKPYATGPQTAIVVGLKDHRDEEIVCDEHGRVRVQFNWDREHDFDEDSSCLIRVSSSWAGSNWGQISLPRVGQEVIVDFLNGDADYPIIIGRVYNAEHKPPYDLPRWKEYATIKSRSTKHGGNYDFNEMRFLDTKGREQVFIHSQKRMDIRVRGSEYHTVGGSRHDLIGWTAADGTKGGDHYHTVGKDCEWHTTNDHTEKVDGTLDHTVAGETKILHQARCSEVVRGRLSTAADELIFEADSKISLKVGGSSIVIDAMGVSVDGRFVKLNCGAFGTDASPANTKNPYDAYGADTGEPGYLDRVRGGWGPRTRTYNDGSVHHAVQHPRAGEDPRMTAIRNNLAGTERGRQVLEAFDRSGANVTFLTTQATEFNPTTNTINVNPNQGNSVTGFAHEMGHAQVASEHRRPDVNTMTRADYIRAQLAEDAHNERQAYETETAPGSTTGQHNTITRTTYMNAYNAEHARLAAAEPNASPEDIERRSHDAAENALMADYMAGRVTTGNTSPPQSYRDYWGADYDAHHPATP